MGRKKHNANQRDMFIADPAVRKEAPPLLMVEVDECTIDIDGFCWTHGQFHMTYVDLAKELI